MQAFSTAGKGAITGGEDAGTAVLGRDTALRNRGPAVPGSEPSCLQATAGCRALALSIFRK